LQWTDNATTETGFSVERAPDNGGVAGTYATIATLGANVTAFTDGGLLASTRYWYRVRAFNAGGNSAYSNAFAVTTLAPGAAPIDVYVHAHQDDWQLFMGDRAANSWQTTAALVLIYATAGDAGNGVGYYEQRELGAQAAFKVFSGAGTVTCAMRTISGHSIRRCVLGKVISYYMRLPDGNTDGAGFGFGSMEQLRDQGIATAAIDRTTTYSSWADFYGTLGAIVDAEMVAANATFVNMNAPDYDRTLNPGDHIDHWATGDAVRAASQTHNWNQWYNTRNLTANVSGPALTMKNNEFQAYDNVMAQRYPSLFNDGYYPTWRQRTYFRTQGN
jgi:LmbE family N-acetylglucosaminyl deacetylase